MFEHLIVPLDGSKVSEQIVPYALWLHQGMSLPLELFYVEEPSVLDHGWDSERFAASKRDTTHQYLERWANSLGIPRHLVSSTVHEGPVADAIVDEAARRPATMIAMTTHGWSGMTRWALGSVASRVVHAASCPVLVVRAGENVSQLKARAMPQRMIVPLDGSSWGEQVLPCVRLLAQAHHLEVVLVRVLEPAYQLLMNGVHPPLDATSLEAITRVASNHAQEYLDDVAHQLWTAGVYQVQTMVCDGHPGSAIVDLAHRTEASMVAMATHGRTGLGRWALGSVADKVIRQSNDPVLVVRTQHVYAKVDAPHPESRQRRSLESHPQG